MPKDKKTSKARYKALTSGEVFGTLRILVIGRPNAGKSTLIKLMLGLPDKKGPGSTKKQDIDTEWSHPTLPLKVHECDVTITPEDPEAHEGMMKKFMKHTLKGSDPELKEVEKFLKPRMKKTDMAEHVHMVWFVMSALDEQNGTNAKLLKELGSYEKLPILTVVTHKDKDPEGAEYQRNVEAHLSEIFHDVPDKERVMGDILMVSNDVENDNIDDDALSALSVKTNAHLDDPELQAAWAAAQVVDFQEKIRLSAKQIAGYKEAAILASPSGLFPGPHQTIMGSLLTGLCRALCRIWAVPKPFKKSLKQNLASQEVYNKQIHSLLQKFQEMGKGALGLGPFAGLATKAAVPFANKVLSTAVMTSIADSLAVSIAPVAVAAATVGWVYASRNDAYNSMLAMVSLGIMVSGAILYVKASYDPRGWNENRTKEEYDNLIKEFVDMHGPDLKQHVGEHHSVSDVFNPERDREQIVTQLEEYFQRISNEHGGHEGQASHS